MYRTCQLCHCSLRHGTFMPYESGPGYCQPCYLRVEAEYAEQKSAAALDHRAKSAPSTRGAPPVPLDWSVLDRYPAQPEPGPELPARLERPPRRDEKLRPSHWADWA